MSFEIGANVGPYQILEQLGQGGMATVYKAYHPALDRFVAIKVLHSAFLEDESFLARFKREAKVVAQLDHPNIVPIYDFAEEKKQPYLIMKYIEGETLKSRLQRQKLSNEEIIFVAEKIAAALSYAHKKHIVHRDVKPSNVLFSKDEQVYLADFGLARIAQGSNPTLTTEQMIGTPQYISPEQALSQSDLDYHTDIYSLGVMLYELFVGKVPFNADTPFAIVHDHIYTPLPLPRLVNPQVSENVERVLLKALAKKPADRYDSVDSLIKALKEAIEIVQQKPSAKTSVVDTTIKSQKNKEVHSGPPQIVPPVILPEAIPPISEQNQTLISSTKQGGKQKSKKVLGWIFGAFGALILCIIIFIIAKRWSQNVQNEISGIPPTLQAQVVVSPTASFEGLYWQEQARQAIEAYNKGSLEQYLEGFSNIKDAWFYRDAISQVRVFDFFYDKQAWVLAGMVIKEPGPLFLESDPFFNPHVHEAFYKAAGKEMANADLLFTEDLNTLTIPSEIGLIRYNFLRGKFSSPDEVIRKLTIIKQDANRYKNYPEVDLLLIEIYEKSEPEKVDPLINEILTDINGIYPEWIKKIAEEKTSL